MQFILENYMAIVLIGFFFVFALIGYLIDLLRKGSNEYKADEDEYNESIEIAKNNEIKTDNIEDKNKINEKTIDNSDELLKNYDKDDN